MLMKHLGVGRAVEEVALDPSQSCVRALVARPSGEDGHFMARFEEPLKEGSSQIPGPARQKDLHRNPFPVPPRSSTTGAPDSRANSAPDCKLLCTITSELAIE